MQTFNLASLCQVAVGLSSSTERAIPFKGVGAVLGAGFLIIMEANLDCTR